jgi:hypothetical protein
METELILENEFTTCPKHGTLHESLADCPRCMFEEMIDEWAEDYPDEFTRKEGTP